MAMASTVGAGEEEGATTKGEAALERLRSADPVLYLLPSPELSALARDASSHLFLSLVPLCPNPPIDRLLAGEGFDAEQVWFQVDLLSRPILALLRREFRRLERDPPSFAPLESVRVGVGGKDAEEAAEEEEGEGDDRFDDEDDDDEERAEGDGDEGEDDDDDDEEEEEEEDEEEGGKRVGGVEDRFFKIKELEEYLEKGEAEEYGKQELGSRTRDKKKRKAKEEDEDEDEDGSDEEEDDGDDLDWEDFGDDASEEADGAENARYEDFYGGKAKKGRDEKDGGKKKKSSSKKV